VGWYFLTAGALLIAAYAMAVLVVPGFGAPFLADRRAVMPAALWFHFAGGAIALVVGPLQLARRLRERWAVPHRWLGGAYVIAVVASGLAALRMAPAAETGFAAGAGFATLAALWIGTTITALARILAGDREGHRRWMYRSYALTFAAVTLRLWIPALSAAGLAFAAIYPAIAWLCWVPNLLVVEWLVLGREARPVSARPATATG
jgi:hypothetical protein